MSAAAEWIAPVATMIAAMMTAANLGVRPTGWGFVVFTIASIAWTVVGVSGGQNNLIAANGFLTLVNIVGVWRWLGRETKYEDRAGALASESEARSSPTLVPLSSLNGLPVEGPANQTIASVVDAMVGTDGRLHSLLVRHGGVAGVGERVVLIDAADFAIEPGRISACLSAGDLADLPEAGDAAHGGG